MAVKGHPGRVAPTIGDLAGYLLLRHHSMVELVNRAEAAGVVSRRPDAADARVVRVELTRKGDGLITRLTRAHLAELHDLAATLHDLIPDEEIAKAPGSTSAEDIGSPLTRA